MSLETWRLLFRIIILSILSARSLERALFINTRKRPRNSNTNDLWMNNRNSTRPALSSKWKTRDSTITSYPDWSGSTIIKRIRDKITVPRTNENVVNAFIMLWLADRFRIFETLQSIANHLPLYLSYQMTIIRTFFFSISAIASRTKSQTAKICNFRPRAPCLLSRISAKSFVQQSHFLLVQQNGNEVLNGIFLKPCGCAICASGYTL